MCILKTTIYLYVFLLFIFKPTLYSYEEPSGDEHVVFGKVYFDENKNHIFDEFEMPIEGANVTVGDKSAITDKDGNYNIKINSLKGYDSVERINLIAEPLLQNFFMTNDANYSFMSDQSYLHSDFGLYGLFQPKVLNTGEARFYVSGSLYNPNVYIKGSLKKGLVYINRGKKKFVKVFIKLENGVPDSSYGLKSQFDYVDIDNEKYSFNFRTAVEKDEEVATWRLVFYDSIPLLKY
jgi:hypothetical protein